ncbi:TPA: endonuclease [Patescibacteria group bacterium]|nr:endonuclease [Patescibacteria group bacterium]
MKYCVYVLRSLRNDDIYVGSTENIEKRISLHNAGKVRSTKPNRPWKLLEHYEYNSRSEAVKQEGFLKTHQQKEMIKRTFGHVVK